MVRPFLCSSNFLRRAFSAAPTASFGHPPMPSIGSPARIHRLISAQADPLLAKEIFDVASSLRPDLPLRPSSLHSLILKLASGGHFSASSSLLRRLPSPSPALLSSLFLTFSRLGRPDLALYTFRRLVSSPSPSTPPRPKLFRRLLSALAAHPSSLPSALSLLKSSPSFGVPHSVRAHNVLIHAFARTGNVAVAYSLFNRLFALDLAPDTSTYRILMQALCRKSQVSTACNLLDDMLNKGYTPDALTYTTLLNSLCRKKRLREAYKLLCRMKVRGCNPDIVHYNTLIVGLCRQGRPLDACKVLEDMPDKGCFPNLVSYSTLIHGLCAQGQYDQGLAYLELMLSKELVPHFSVAHALVKGLCSVGKVEEACRVMEATLRHGVAPHVDTWDLVVAGVCDDDMEQPMDYIRKVANEEEWRKNTRIVQVGRGLNEYMVNKSSKSTRHGSQTK